MGVKILNFFIIDSQQLSDLKKIHREKLRKNYFKRNETFEKFFINRFVGFGGEMFSAMWNWTAQEYFTNNIRDG